MLVVAWNVIEVSFLSSLKLILPDISGKKCYFSLFIIWQQKKDVFAFQSSRESNVLERETTISIWDFAEVLTY